MFSVVISSDGIICVPVKNKHQSVIMVIRLKHQIVSVSYRRKVLVQLFVRVSRLEIDIRKSNQTKMNVKCGRGLKIKWNTIRKRRIRRCRLRNRRDRFRKNCFRKNCQQQLPVPHHPTLFIIESSIEID